MRGRWLATAGVLVLLLAPAPANADGFVSPYIGVPFGGATDFGDPDNNINFGASAGWMGAGIIGVEVDLSYNPNFFGDGADFGDSNVTTLMGNVIIGAPLGGEAGSWRPYASGGVGLMKTRLDDFGDLFEDVDNNDFGMNIGAGVMGFFNDRVGLRGDIRYFRNLTDNEPDNEFDIAVGDFDFWRATVGVAFRF